MKSCCCCLILTSISFFSIVFLAFLTARANTFPATNFTNVKYDDDGTTLHAYFVKPESPGNNTPAVILFHAWNGMSEDVTYFADELAMQGYYVIAPDLFRGVAADGMNIIWNIFNILTVSQTRLDKDSDAALSYLTAMENVDENRISSGPGFCYGGTQSLIFASRHTMAATVTCYGTYVRELHDADSKAWGKLKSGGPILGIYGEEDTAPSPDDAKALGEALEKNGISHNITIYKGVGHGFIKSYSQKDSGAKDYQTTISAWNEIEEFLSTSFKTSRRFLGTLKTAGLDDEPDRKSVV